MFLVVGHQVCVHLRRDFVPLFLQILAKSLRFWGWRLATQTFSSLHRFSVGLRSGDWLGHSRTLMYFLSDSFVVLALCFGSLSRWNTHPRPIFNTLVGFNALALTVHRPFDAVQLSCPFSRKTPQKHNVYISMFDGGGGVLRVIGSIPPPPNTVSWVDAKELEFGLIWPQHFHPVLLWIIGKLQTGCTCAFLSRGTLRALQDFSPSWRSVLLIVFLVTMVPTALRSLTRSTCGVMGWFLTVLMIIEDLAWSPSLREIYSYFVFLPFANNHTNCCHLLTKMLGDSLVAHTNLV